ncbi:unnamed protein product [Rotaria sp. Silwood2]|nr:unnamed protein product [Rotaria sp. Silwood2]
MPDTATTNQLPLRTTTSSRWPRKWATIGGRGTSSSSITMIPTKDSNLNDNTSKKTNNNNHHHSTSLLRQSSTINRTNDRPITFNENSDQSLKKSRSLMDVLRSKLNSPAVLRRFRSKSRESTKQSVTEINGHTTTTNEQTEIKQSNNEQTTTTTRKSRKRDPSPIKRFTNRLSQLTRHQRTKSNERQQQSPSKSIINDSNNNNNNNEPEQSATPIHNQDKIDHINACYDEIRAKYFNDNDIKKPSTSNNENDSSFNNDFLNNFQHTTLPLPSDDPLLQARKQSNIKLNCMLSGYTLTKSFANHEKLFDQNDLFKYNHYYDVGKRKYDWNFTNNNNRIFSSMRTKPISKSIDSFRHMNTNENQVSVTLEKVNVINNDSLVQRENNENITRILPDDNELVIREDNDLIDSEKNILHNLSNVHVTSTIPINVKTYVSTSSNQSDKNEIISNEHSMEENDEEFERNFLRAVNRALGVVNKDKNELTQTIYDIPKETDESHLNLIQMTEQALSSLNNSTLFTNDDEKAEQVDNSIELTKAELVDRTNESSNIEEISTITNENQQEINNDNFINDEHILSVIDDLIRKTEDLLFEESKNGRTFLVKLDDEEKIIKSKADAYNKLLQTDDNRLNEDVRTDINAVIGEVNLLLRGKLKQFRGLCERNTTGGPIPLDSDLEGFWDITYPLIDKVKEKFAKLDARKAKQWAPIEEYDPNDVNNRPRVIDDRLKQLQPQQNKSSKNPTTKAPNEDLKKLIQERRKAAANATNQNHDIEIFGISTNAWTKAKPRMFSPSCQCAKGERGEKGDPGICPANCISRDNSYSNDCLGSHIKLQHLAQSIRQLIIDTKQIANRNARTTSCTCSASSPPSTATTTISTRLSPSSIDYNMYMRLKGDKGDKGDAGISCISNCQQSTQLNIRIFPTIEAATDAYHDYPDHTYVHIVNEQGRLQSVLIRIHRRLVPLGLETELHIFALGPRTRRMCNPNRPNKLCSKLSDYDSLCERISERYHLTGFYRAFMSSSTQWLANLFDGVCINPKIINMNGQVLFDTFEEIFERKSPQNVILDVQGSKPQ